MHACHSTASDVPWRFLACVLLLAANTACHRSQAREPQSIDWRTSPLDLDLRGMNGRRYRFHCPAGKPEPGSVAGSDIYTDASSICTAGVHAGAIDARRGGDVAIEILPGRSDYPASARNFVQSQAYAPTWGGSFAVLSVDDADRGE